MSERFTEMLIDYSSKYGKKSDMGQELVFSCWLVERELNAFLSY